MLSAAGERNEYLHRPCIDARRHCSTTVKLQALHCPWLVEGGQFEREPATARAHTHTHLMYTEVWIVLSLSSGVAIILAPFGWRGEEWGATLTMPNFVCNTPFLVMCSLFRSIDDRHAVHDLHATPTGRSGRSGGTKSEDFCDQKKVGDRIEDDRSWRRGHRRY